MREAQRKGATLIVVDPRRTALAKQADLHIALRPGTDLPVALALHRFLFENGLADETFLRDHATGVAELRAAAAPWTIARAAAVAGLEPETLEQFARLYATASPALIRCGWGLERNRNGGHAAMAVLGLPAVAGKFGVRGGGYSMSNSGAWQLNNRDWIGVDAPATRVVNMNVLGEALQTLRDPKIEVLFVYNANPVATIPDQNAVIRGLEREDLFTVVFEQVRTDTVPYADVVLPATTFLEHYDLNRSYGGHAMLLVKPVIEPVGESRPNADVFSELEVRLGLSEGPTEDETEALFHVARRLPGDTGEVVLADGVALPPGGNHPIQFVDVHPAHRRRQGPPVPRRRADAGARRPLQLPGGSRHRRSPAGADLAGQREDDQLDARRAADAPRGAAHEHRGCRGARRRHRRCRPRVQRARRGALPGGGHRRHPRRHGQPGRRGCGGAARSTSRRRRRSPRRR